MEWIELFFLILIAVSATIIVVNLNDIMNYMGVIIEDIKYRFIKNRTIKKDKKEETELPSSEELWEQQKMYFYK